MKVVSLAEVGQVLRTAIRLIDRGRFHCGSPCGSFEGRGVALLPSLYTYPFRRLTNVSLTPNIAPEGGGRICSVKLSRTTALSKNWAEAGWVWFTRPRTRGSIVLLP
jgi:hypothetical protein